MALGHTISTALNAILDCVDDICRGAQLCAPTRRVLHPIENRYQGRIIEQLQLGKLHFLTFDLAK
ncbi:hypothetical protein IQ272_01670 [Chroococcidiopsidales cyanobacterium LEGE 13417]|uniref:hypothetical protein n=1 Tax=Chroococcidiopsis sp. CCALA 051 TaxID=869949 RepID=UPI0011B2369F|nr:hypothetical protein [Chroococcidiopsis sp. CCALA 051]MBE9014877.1 hypothetical protein [Chroococcidiopsidales cyanobacterium LEGE 13417]